MAEHVPGEHETGDKDTASAASIRTGKDVEQGAGPAQHAGPKMTWRALDWLQTGLTALCGAILVAFTGATLLDVVTRTTATPIGWLQNFILGAFVWGVFLGACVAQRRREHFRIAALADKYTGLRRQLFESLESVVVLLVAVWMIWFGYLNVLTSGGNQLQPSGVPLSAVTVCIPVAGLLLALFSIERLYHVWRFGKELKPQSEVDIILAAEGGMAGSSV